MLRKTSIWPFENVPDTTASSPSETIRSKRSRLRPLRATRQVGPPCCGAAIARPSHSSRVRSRIVMLRLFMFNPERVQFYAMAVRAASALPACLRRRSQVASLPMLTSRPSFRSRLSSFVWRALARYGRFKYRRLLPLYRALGLCSKGSKVTEITKPVASLQRARRLTDWLARANAAGLRKQVEAIAARAAESRATIIFLPSVGWQISNTQRCHHLAREFARQGYTVVFDCSNAYDPVNG